MGFRENVLQLLKDKNLSQSDLAVMINKPRQNVSTLLKKDSPSHKTLLEFARALNVDPAELVVDDTVDPVSLNIPGKMPTPYSRLLSYIQTKSVDPDEVSKKLNVSFEKIRRGAIQGFRMPDGLINALNNFEDLNVTWILSGQGPMLLDQSEFILDNQIDDPQKYYERLWEFLVIEEISIESFSQRTGIPKSIIIDGMEGKVGATAYYAQEITKRYPQVDPIWLISGEGEMIKKEYQRDPIRPKDDTDRLYSTNLELIRGAGRVEFRDLGYGRFLVTSPLVLLSDQKRYVQEFSDREFIKELPLHAVVIEQLHFGKYRSFETTRKVTTYDVLEFDEEDNVSFVDREIDQKTIVTGRLINNMGGKRMALVHRGTEFVVVVKEGVFFAKTTQEGINDGILQCTITLGGQLINKTFNKNDTLELYTIEIVTNYY